MDNILNEVKSTRFLAQIEPNAIKVGNSSPHCENNLFPKGQGSNEYLGDEVPIQCLQITHGV